ncbi:hypothetical protein K1719_015175 [Acacia pycnantha]|nr:hypothetical protein K1719_015175 [Acacia pycnantha]
MSRREANPHFTRPLRPPPRDHAHHPPLAPAVPPPPPHQLFPPREDPSPSSYHPKQVRISEPPQPTKHVKSRKTPPTPPSPPPRDKPRRPNKLIPTPGPSSAHEPHVPHQPITPPPPPSPRPQSSPRHHDRRGHRYGGLRVPDQKKTKPHTWLFAIFCLIFWLVIIIGGLIVLIVYLVFRPQSPNFEVSSASLNAAYLDMGYLLNADVTLLANFTNPNKKVHVDFSTTMIYLYYGSTLIATQYVEPFSTSRAESRFATIRMVASQVQLPLAETQRLVKQVQSNGIILEVKGVFRARSTLGRILRYSYNLYGYCTIMLTRPPGGVLIKRNCRTKR